MPISAAGFELFKLRDEYRATEWIYLRVDDIRHARTAKDYQLNIAVMSQFWS